MHWRTCSARSPLPLAACLVALPMVSALAAEPTPTLNQNLDLSLGGAAGATKVGLSWSPLLNLFDDRLTLGLGARATDYVFGDGVSFASGDSSLLVSGGHAFSFNVFVQARVRVFAGLELGANIDAIGYGAGSTVTGAFSSPGSPASIPVRASVSHFNLLGFGSGDRGQLDSEFFAGYRFGDWGVRAGLTHFANELTTAEAQVGGRSRFRHAFTGGFAAVSFRF